MYLKQILAWTGVAILAIVVFGVFWYFLLAPAPKQAASPTQTGTLPVSNPVETTGSGTGSGGTGPGQTSVPQGGSPLTGTTTTSQTITIAERGRSPITVTDFIHNGVTIPDPANPGRYLLAGSLGYCPTGGGPCGTASTTSFNIFYDSTSQYFLIGLTKEPIGAARLAAQQFLLQTLGINEAQACALVYYVGTTYDVNPVYSGENLGFSFCPGAVPLPQ